MKHTTPKLAGACRFFNIQPAALSIMHLLYDGMAVPLPPDSADVKMNFAPFYNGRERFINLQVHIKGRTRNIMFGEARNSDSVIVQTFDTPCMANPPCLNDVPEASYWERHNFSPNDVSSVIDHIRNLTRTFVSDQNKKGTSNGE